MSRLCLIVLSIGFLTACETPVAANSKTLYTCRDWPKEPKKPRKQSDVAEYIVKGNAAWKSCNAALNLVKPKE